MTDGTSRGDNREDLQDQHAIAEEIGQALRGGPGANSVDEADLDAELEELQNEELDNTMLKGGSVPVNQRLPAAASGECKSCIPSRLVPYSLHCALPSFRLYIDNYGRAL